MKSQQTYGVSAFNHHQQFHEPKIKPGINSKSFCLICLSSTLLHPSYPWDFVGGSPSLCKGNHRRRHNWTHHDRGSPTHLWPESVEFTMVVVMMMTVVQEAERLESILFGQGNGGTAKLCHLIWSSSPAWSLFHTYKQTGWLKMLNSSSCQFSQSQSILSDLSDPLALFFGKWIFHQSAIKSGVPHVFL